MKIGYFAYIMLLIVEYLLFRKNIILVDKYIYSRLFTASYLPLVMMVIYLLGPLVFGKFQSIAAEIIFANIALFLTFLSVFIVKKHVEGSPSPYWDSKLLSFSYFLFHNHSLSFLLLNYLV